MGMSPRYDLTLDGQKAGSVKKMLGVWHEFVFVTDLNWLIFGNLLANEYHIYHGVKTVTTIAAVGAATSTTFKIDILDPRNVHAGLLVAAVLDRWRFVHLTNPLTRGSLAYTSALKRGSSWPQARTDSQNHFNHQHKKKADPLRVCLFHA